MVQLEARFAEAIRYTLAEGEVVVWMGPPDPKDYRRWVRAHVARNPGWVWVVPFGIISGGLRWMIHGLDAATAALLLLTLAPLLRWAYAELRAIGWWRQARFVQTSRRLLWVTRPSRLGWSGPVQSELTLHEAWLPNGLLSRVWEVPAFRGVRIVTAASREELCLTTANDSLFRNPLLPLEWTLQCFPAPHARIESLSRLAEHTSSRRRRSLMHIESFQRASPEGADIQSSVHAAEASEGPVTIPEYYPQQPARVFATPDWGVFTWCVVLMVLALGVQFVVAVPARIAAPVVLLFAMLVVARRFHNPAPGERWLLELSEDGLRVCSSVNSRKVLRTVEYAQIETVESYVDRYNGATSASGVALTVSKGEPLVLQLDWRAKTVAKFLAARAGIPMHECQRSWTGATD